MFLDKNISELKEDHSQKGNPSFLRSVRFIRCTDVILRYVSSCPAVCFAESSQSLSNQKVYGEPLLSHLSQSNREIAAPIQECIHMLLRTGMREEVPHSVRSHNTQTQKYAN